MQAMLENLALVARGRLASCRRAAGSMPRTSPTCWPSCARSTPSPGCASPGRGCRRRAGRARAPGAGRRLDGRAQHRDAAAGAGEQRLCGAHPAARTPPPAPSSRSAAPARAGWCGASSSGRGPSSRSRPRSCERQDRFFSRGVAELRPLTQRAVAGKLGLHEFNRQPCRGGKIPLLRPGLLRFPLLLQLGDPGGLGRRGLFRRGGPGADPRPRARRARAAHAVGRQNRGPAEGRGD